MEIKVRYLVGIMIFLGYFLMYVVRYNLSVHIVDMAQLDLRGTLPLNIARNNETENKPIGRSQLDIFNWDDWKVARLFSAYYIGFCVCFPIFHNIGDRLGPTWVVGIAGMASGVLNCLTPASAYFNFWCLLIVRVFVGFCAGAMQPSLVQLLRYWVPPVERIHFMWAYCDGTGNHRGTTKRGLIWVPAIVRHIHYILTYHIAVSLSNTFLGLTTGTFATLLICAAVQYTSRWPLGFYISGTTQIIWSAAWVMVITDKPRKHPCITEDELTYLTNTIGTIFTIKLTNSQIPWKLIARSKEFWALCILDFGYAWMIMALCLYGPMYYTLLGKFNLFYAAILTSLPFLIRLILGTIIIHLFHWYKHNTNIKDIKYIKIRKYLIVVSHVIPGCLVASSWFYNVSPGPIFLTISVGLTAAGMDLTLDLAYELTPTYANSVSTVIKIIGNTPGIIIPFCVGAITQYYKDNPYVWKHIWCFHGVVLTISGLVFLIWGDVQVQPWNSIRRSHPSKCHALPRPSMMSNIAELDEDDSTIQMSVPTKKKSLLSTVSLKMLLPK